MRTETLSTEEKLPQVVIIGGGFGGLYAAQSLARVPVEMTLLDKRNFHLFQPLLYQVATGGLSPAEIASPLRAVLKRYRNIRVLQAEAVDLDPDRRQVILRDGEVDFDTLIVATGSSHHYFGHDEWREKAPGLKTIEDALEIRRRVLGAFEQAEREPDPGQQQAWMTFVIVGGGPTGVELAGAIGELAQSTLRGDFRRIDPGQAKIYLVEGEKRLLPTYPPDLSAQAERALTRLGVTVSTRTLVTCIEADQVTVRSGDQESTLSACTVLWGAGMKASPWGQILAQRTGAELDRMGRVVVEPDLSIPDHPHLFVLGDLAHFGHQDGSPLPGVAAVAMQQGRYVADRIRQQLQGLGGPPFRYRFKGSMAVIGRHAAVADLGFLRFAGFSAWCIWLFVHILYLVGFENKLLVLIQWAWNYWTRNRGARLITGEEPVPLEGEQDPKG